MKRGNIFALKNKIRNTDPELFETLFAGNNCKVERIVSAGHTTPEGQWYDQARDEWVVLLSGNAKLEFAGGENIILETGDFIFIPAHQKHRVAYTSSKPLCVWLAIHGDLQG